jgi:hypothetical protein
MVLPETKSVSSSGRAAVAVVDDFVCIFSIFR